MRKTSCGTGLSELGTVINYPQNSPSVASNCTEHFRPTVTAVAFLFVLKSRNTRISGDSMPMRVHSIGAWLALARRRMHPAEEGANGSGILRGGVRGNRSPLVS